MYSSRYYNAGKEVEVPKQMPKEDNPQDDPIVVEIAMSKVGTLKVWPTSDEYMGSTTGNVKLVDEGDGVYVTEFEIRETADGEFRYKKISIETLDDGVSFSEVRIYLGDEELESDGGSIRFDEERKFNKGDAVPVKVEVVDFQNANDVAEPLKIVFHSVQDNVSDFEIVIEKPE
ncbi:TPA: hypothetical protein EYP13_00830 [Candidatus Micrarchaeota archaeon]|nr:hypothetical protein [Candidatus Micrarchaeota archaeon]